MEAKDLPGGRITTHVGLPSPSRRVRGKRKRRHGGKTKTQKKRQQKSKSKPVKRAKPSHEGWEEFVADVQQLQGAPNASLRQTMLTVMQRYGMINDPDEGLAQLQRVVDEHESDPTNVSGDGGEELLLAVFHGDDESRCVELLQASVARNNLDAIYTLGTFLLNKSAEEGPSSALEAEESWKLFRMGAERGHPPALFQVGICFEQKEKDP